MSAELQVIALNVLAPSDSRMEISVTFGYLHGQKDVELLLRQLYDAFHSARPIAISAEPAT